jgi:hypothetical protein
MMLPSSRPIYLWASIKSSPSSLADHFLPTNYFNPAHDQFQNSAHFLPTKFHPFSKFSPFFKIQPIFRIRPSIPVQIQTTYKHSVTS